MNVCSPEKDPRTEVAVRHVCVLPSRSQVGEGRGLLGRNGQVHQEKRRGRGASIWGKMCGENAGKDLSPAGPRNNLQRLAPRAKAAGSRGGRSGACVRRSDEGRVAPIERADHALLGGVTPQSGQGTLGQSGHGTAPTQDTEPEDVGQRPLLRRADQQTVSCGVYVGEHFSFHGMGKADRGELWSPTVRGKSDRTG